MDSAADSEDITLLRQSQRYLKELGQAFANIEEISSERQLDTIIQKIEPYQEDPQLLDAALGRFVPLLSEKFLSNLEQPVTLHHLSRILYTFCKVRGDRVIVGLFNNEPRWIEPLLAVFDGDKLPWEENYILLLWLSHLMLSPFDLATISSFDAKNIGLGLELPDDTPSIAAQVLKIGLSHLGAATIERKAASLLVVRLCVRQDMLKIGMLGIITRWAITEFELAAKLAKIHTCLGTLTFLSGLVAAGDQRMLGSLLSSIFGLSQKILEEESLSLIRNSAIARKLVIKVQRNTVIHCLQTEQHELDTTEVVEQVISSLIELLADSDTPVRMAASKALSLVTLKLDSDMADEVVEAINAAFHEDLVGDDMKTFFSVNAAKWHGIALTFGHLLQRRAVSVNKIPSILQSILYALSFEQRSPNGKSIGSNVRDAANYGLWAVARRFTTKELQSISADEFSIHGEVSTQSSLQYIANNLLVSACLDPDGNVRRGSSAALQELIGRHPNTIAEGIALVQVVDYQGVGLRARASTKIAAAASSLDRAYEAALIAGLFTWRGVSAASFANRSDTVVFAGMLIARISPNEFVLGNQSTYDPASAIRTANELTNAARERSTQLRARDHEERQGLMLVLSWVLSALCHHLSEAASSSEHATFLLEYYKDFVPRNESSPIPELVYIVSEDFKPRAPRSELVISAALRLFGQLAALIRLLRGSQPDLILRWEKHMHFKFLSKSLTRADEEVLEQIPDAVRLSIPLLSAADAAKLAKQWLEDLLPENKRPGAPSAPKILALGAAFNELAQSSEDDKEDMHQAILHFLLERYQHVDTEARIVILQALRLILIWWDKETRISKSKGQDHLMVITTMLLLSLHDYTISERGDVGSLVRLAGLDALKEAWAQGLLLRDDGMRVPSSLIKELNSLCLDAYDGTQNEEIPFVGHLQASVLRLGLEKLDKVRIAAISCWKSQVDNKESQNDANNKSSDIRAELRPSTTDDITFLLTNGAPIPPKTVPDYDISSAPYFYQFLDFAALDTTTTSVSIRIIEGFCSTAGAAVSGASQNLLNAREALHTFLSHKDNGPRNATTFATLLKDAIDVNVKLENDQRLVSILEVAAFVADMGLLRFNDTSPKAFFTSIQKAHYKSRNIPKLQICLDVYRGLVYIDGIRAEVEKKIVSMLLHPIPAVRITAAETLVFMDGMGKVAELLVKEDWTRPAKDLKGRVEDIGKSISAR